MPLTTIKSSNIGTGAISSSDLDTTYLTPTGDGSSLTGVDSGLQSVQVFTTSGTWTKPSGISKVIIEIQGAGGSGGGSGGYYYGSGGAGGYAKKMLDVSSISSSTITVGSGGASVSAGTGAGNAGGASSWADGTNTVTGNGGSGYSGGYKATTSGSTGTGGDINIKGGNGGYYGNEGVTPVGCNLEANAAGYGCAGSNGSSSHASGAGGGGIVIVWEYK